MWPHRHRFVALALLALGACSAPLQPRPEPATTDASPATPTVKHGARQYHLLAAQSKLHILVYRGGPMAHLGHNHVISSEMLSGEIWLHDDLLQSSFALRVPVNELVVDDAEARAQEGEDFSAVVSAAARAGTKRNLLKPEQLDSEHYPLVHLVSTQLSGTGEQLRVGVRLTIKDHSMELVVPVRLLIDDTSLRASGVFSLRQTDVGIQPYSVALGAIQVQDQVTIKFELVAVLAEG